MLLEDELQYQVWRTTGEKTEEKIEGVKARRKQNREEQESYGDGHMIQPPTMDPENEWKDQEDPFGIRNLWFQEEGKLVFITKGFNYKLTTLKDSRVIVKILEV